MTSTARITLCLSTVLLALSTATPGRAEGPEDRILFPGAARFILAGPYGGVTINSHNGRFATTENGLLCCAFDEGSGLGLVAGLKAFIPLGRGFDLSPRLHYENAGGTFSALVQNYPIRGRANTVEYVTLDNELDVTLHTVSADVLLTYTFTSFGLYAALGPAAGYRLGNRFVKTETITAPPGVEYVGGGTTRELYNGSFDLVRGFSLTVRGGLGALIPISRSVTLNPEVLYGLPLTTTSTDGAWEISTLHATLGVLFPL